MKKRLFMLFALVLGTTHLFGAADENAPTVSAEDIAGVQSILQTAGLSASDKKITEALSQAKKQIQYLTTNTAWIGSNSWSLADAYYFDDYRLNNTGLINAALRDENQSLVTLAAALYLAKTDSSIPSANDLFNKNSTDLIAKYTIIPRFESRTVSDSFVPKLGIYISQLDEGGKRKLTRHIAELRDPRQQKTSINVAELFLEQGILSNDINDPATKNMLEMFVLSPAAYKEFKTLLGVSDTEEPGIGGLFGNEEEKEPAQQPAEQAPQEKEEESAQQPEEQAQQPEEPTSKENAMPTNLKQLIDDFESGAIDANAFRDAVKLYHTRINTSFKAGDGVIFSPLMYAVKLRRHAIDATKILLDNGALVNWRTPSGYTALMEAADNRDIANVRGLMELFLTPKYGTNVTLRTTKHSASVLTFLGMRSDVTPEELEAIIHKLSDDELTQMIAPINNTDNPAKRKERDALQAEQERRKHAGGAATSGGGKTPEQLQEEASRRAAEEAQLEEERKAKEELEKEQASEAEAKRLQEEEFRRAEEKEAREAQDARVAEEIALKQREEDAAAEEKRKIQEAQDAEEAARLAGAEQQAPAAVTDLKEIIDSAATLDNAAVVANLDTHKDLVNKIITHDGKLYVPLSYAIVTVTSPSKRRVIIKRLLLNDADINKRAGTDKTTPLIYAARLADDGKFELVKYLLETANANPKLRDQAGYSVLSTLISTSHEKGDANTAIAQLLSNADLEALLKSAEALNGPIFRDERSFINKILRIRKEAAAQPTPDLQPGEDILADFKDALKELDSAVGERETEAAPAAGEIINLPITELRSLGNEVQRGRKLDTAEAQQLITIAKTNGKTPVEKAKQRAAISIIMGSRLDTLNPDVDEAVLAEWNRIARRK